ncbi:MAG: DUF1579 domain-containing protein [Candidatus Zixiibacteriota bacterium]
MRTRTWQCIAIALVVPLAGATVMAQESGKSGAPGDSAAMAAMMEAMLKYSTPGPEHKFLEKLTGHWTGDLKMWMDPAAPPTETKGTSHREMLLGGRWLKEDVHSDFMGQPFTGMWLVGYDNFRQRFVSLWMDDMSTGTMLSYGTLDTTGTVLTCSGTMDDPATGEKDKKFRSVLRVTGPDAHVEEMYSTIPGQGEVKVMEIHYTRAK